MTYSLYPGHDVVGPHRAHHGRVRG